MAGKQSSDNGGTSALISGHWLFQSFCAFAGAALLAGSTLMIPGSLFDRLIAASGAVGLLPAAVPLGEMLHMLLAGMAALVGGWLGLALARAIAVAQFNAHRPSSERMARIRGIRTIGDTERAQEPSPTPAPQPRIERETLNGGEWEADGEEEWLAEPPREAAGIPYAKWQVDLPREAEQTNQSSEEAPSAPVPTEPQHSLPPPLGTPRASAPPDAPVSAFRAPRLAAAPVEPGLMSRLQALQTGTPAAISPPAPAVPSPDPSPFEAFEAEVDGEGEDAPAQAAETEDWPSLPLPADGAAEDGTDWTDKNEAGEFGAYEDVPIIDAALGAFRDYARDYAGGDEGEEEEDAEDDFPASGGGYGSLLGMTVRRRAADEPIELVGFDGETMSDAETDIPVLEEAVIDPDYASPLLVRRRIGASN